MKSDVIVIGVLIALTLIGAVVVTLAGADVPPLLADAATFLLGALAGAAGLTTRRTRP